MPGSFFSEKDNLIFVYWDRSVLAAFLYIVIIIINIIISNQDIFHLIIDRLFLNSIYLLPLIGIVVTLKNILFNTSIQFCSLLIRRNKIVFVFSVCVIISCKLVPCIPQGCILGIGTLCIFCHTGVYY